MDDPSYFTLDHDWSLLSFLQYRQKCGDFLYDKKKEHARYVRNLSSLLNYEQGTEEVKRAGRAIVSFQVKYFFFSFWLAGNYPHFLTAIRK